MEEIVPSFDNSELLSTEIENKMLKEKVKGLENDKQTCGHMLRIYHKEIERLKDTNTSLINEKERKELELNRKYAELQQKYARQNTILAGNTTDISNSTCLEKLRKTVIAEFESEKNVELITLKWDLLALKQELDESKQMLVDEAIRQLEVNATYEKQLDQKDEIIVSLQHELLKKYKAESS